MDFVNAPTLAEDPTSILDRGIDAINLNLTANGFPGWTANDATLAVILLSTVAQLLADAEGAASVVLAAVFRAFGTQLLGVPYQTGAAATVLSTWTFTSPAPTGGYTIGAGTSVIVSGSVFYAQNAVTTGTGDTTASVLLVASQTGTAYNGLGGVNAPATPGDQIDWVSSIVTAGLTSGGADQETDADYQNGLVGELQLQAPRPLVAGDFAGMVLSDTAAAATGVSVGRATAYDLYFPDGRVLSTGGAGSTVLSCTTVNTSPTVTYVGTGSRVPTVGATVAGTGVPGGTTVAASPAPTESTFTLSANATASATNNLTVSAMSGYGPVHLTCTGTTSNASAAVSAVTPPYAGAIADVGARVTGTGIPIGATVIASPAPTASGFSISATATSSNVTETITVSSWTLVPLAVTAFVTDSAGNALPAASMDALGTWLQKYRPQNWLVNVTAPSYNTVYVASQIHVLPGYNSVSVAAAVQSALLAYLNPGTWGNPRAVSTGSNSWLNAGSGFGIVRYNNVLAVAASVAGVAYVPPGSSGLAIGFSASPTGVADLTMVGPAPLPQSTTTSVPLPTVI